MPGSRAVIHYQDHGGDGANASPSFLFGVVQGNRLALLQIKLHMEVSDEADAYLHACARIRNISASRLVERMLRTVCSEQLFLAVLDDDSKQPRWIAGETGKTRFRKKRCV